VGVKPLVAFTPMHEDGCMLLVFTPKYKKWQKIPEDQEAQYYLYIPYGLGLILPGDVVHAGGFCFGRPMTYARKPKSKSKFTNHHLHFFLCPDDASYKEGDGEKNEIYYDDDPDKVAEAALKGNRLPDHPAYAISDGVMKKLGENLLYEYTPEEKDLENNDKEVEENYIPKRKKAKVSKK